MAGLGFRSIRIGVLALTLMSAGCGGASAGQSASDLGEPVVSTSAATTSTTEPSAAPVTEPASVGGSVVLTTEQIEDCTAVSLPSVPQSSSFRFIKEDKLFECLRVDDYKFAATMQMTEDFGQEFDQIEFNSQATLVDGEPRFRSSGAVEGRPYDVTRLGDTVWVTDNDGASYTLNVAGAEAFALLDLESTQAQLTLGGLGLTLIGFYGGGAIQVGSDEFQGRTLTHWTAGPVELTEHINNAAVLPVTVEVRSGSIDIWTDPNGFILRASVDLEADDIFLNGTPAAQFPGATETGLVFDGRYDLSYFDLGVPNMIEAPS